MMIQVEIRIKSAEIQESPEREHGSCGCARVVVLIPYKGVSCRDVQFYALYGEINANCGIIFLLARPIAVDRTLYLHSLPFFPVRCFRYQK